MIFDDLTPEQLRFASHPAEAFVEACPGAGKTRTLVERLNNLSADKPPRRGTALLSYTNSAVDELAVRCRSVGLDHAVRFPNYIGTFDGFLRHFIVLPSGTAIASSRPTVIDNWDSLGVEIRLRGEDAFRGDGLSLEAFDPDADAIDLGSVTDLRLRAHVAAHREAYEREARRRRELLFRQGYLNAKDVRSQAMRRVQEPAWDAALGRALAARFQEVIVDEAQDCNPHDLEIVAWLRRHGVRVTLVADLDQSIYAFRHGLPANLRRFSEAYDADNRLRMTGNFRSSPAICAFASTLRGEARIDQSLGECADVEHPVVILAYAGAAPPPTVSQAFILQVTRFGLDADQAIVLAHKRRSCRSALGIPSEDSRGQSAVETLAHAVGAFWSPASGACAREMALCAIEKLILGFQGLLAPGEHLSRAIARNGVSRRILRRQALEIATKASPTCADNNDAREEWRAAVRHLFERLQLTLREGATWARLLQSPRHPRWSKHLEGEGGGPSIAYSTVHEAKGREYDAVCLVIPPNRAPQNHTATLMDAWEAREDNESKRVVYVGATRARKLLVVAAPRAIADRIARLLEVVEVQFERADI